MILRAIIASIGSYLIGGFLGGALVARLKGVDLSKKGSGSIGTTNVLRTIGPWYAAATLIVDVGKGMAAVYLGRWTGIRGLDAACGLLAIIGHNWPLLTAFRGGKGIATTLGTMIVMAPIAPLILVPLWALIALPTGYVSLGSIIASSMFPFLAAALYRSRQDFWFLAAYALLSAITTVYSHRENIKRLLSGTENNLWRPKKGKQ